MNKKVLAGIVAIIAVVVVVIIVLCVKDNRLTFSLSDEKFGTVSFKYTEEDGYKIEKENTEGYSAEYEIVNEAENLEVDMYFINNWGTFDEYIEMTGRKNKETYKEFTLNDGQYKGYLYSQGDRPESSVDVHILMYEDAEKHEFIELYMYVSPYTYTQDINLVEAFDRATVQKVLNTIEFAKAEQ